MKEAHMASLVQRNFLVFKSMFFYDRGVVVQWNMNRAKFLHIAFRLHNP
jgi:hypothetical protein